MNILDDLKSNFRSWEDGSCDNIGDAEALTAELQRRHPNETPDYVKQLAYEWVGCDSEMEDEEFTPDIFDVYLDNDDERN